MLLFLILNLVKFKAINNKSITVLSEDGCAPGVRPSPTPPPTLARVHAATLPHQTTTSVTQTTHACMCVGAGAGAGARRVRRDSRSRYHVPTAVAGRRTSQY